jgi:hypothetical protein
MEKTEMACAIIRPMSRVAPLLFGATLIAGLSIACGARTGSDLFPDESGLLPGDGGTAGDANIAGGAGDGGTGNVGNNGGTGNVGNNGGTGNVGNNGGTGNVGNNGGKSGSAGNGANGGKGGKGGSAGKGANGGKGGKGGSAGKGANGGKGGSGGVPFPPGECCESHPWPGCEQPDTKTCVCRQDSFCCDEEWDEACVEQAFECGGCRRPPPPPPPGGDCCFPHDHPGCGNPDVMECVCDRDEFCCGNFWDEQCVDEAFACGGCEDTPPPPPPPGGGGDDGGWGGPYPNAESCLMESPGECKACACVACLDGFNACTTDPGCMEILECVGETGCTGPQCLLPWNCGGAILGNGGFGSPSAQNAQELYQCITGSGCPCL